MTRTRIVLLLAVSLIVAPGVPAAGPSDDTLRHLRTEDRRLLRLLLDGARVSETFRQLLERLRRSDVIVYLDCGGRSGSSDGRLAFMSAAGGYRYVHIRVKHLESPNQQIALIGHELQHAVEVANSPGIVDDSSLAREYRRIGYPRFRPGAGMTFDSDAAVRAGYRVLRELAARGTRWPIATGDSQ